MSYVNMRDDVLSVSEGTVKRARRLNKPSNMSWEIGMTCRFTGGMLPTAGGAP